MTKAQEIELLSILIERLGPYSYLGPWLKDQLPDIEADMTADVPPIASFSDCRKLFESAKHDAEEYRELAKREAENIIREAVKAADNEIKSAKHALRTALEKLGA